MTTLVYTPDSALAYILEDRGEWVKVALPAEDDEAEAHPSLVQWWPRKDLQEVVE